MMKWENDGKLSFHSRLFQLAMAYPDKIEGVPFSSMFMPQRSSNENSKMLIVRQNDMIEKKKCKQFTSLIILILAVAAVYDERNHNGKNMGTFQECRVPLDNCETKCNDAKPVDDTSSRKNEKTQRNENTDYRSRENINEASQLKQSQQMTPKTMRRKETIEIIRDYLGDGSKPTNPNTSISDMRRQDHDDYFDKMKKSNKRWRKRCREIELDAKEHRLAYHELRIAYRELEMIHVLMKLEVATARAKDDSMVFDVQKMIAGRDYCAPDALNEYDKLLMRLHSTEKQRDSLLQKLNSVSDKRKAPSMTKRRGWLHGRYSWRKTENKGKI